MSSTNKVARYVARAVGLGMILLAACGGRSPDASIDLTSDSVPDVPAPAIESFTADPNPVVNGSPTTLSWKVSDPAATLRLLPLGREVTGSSIEIEPVVTTTYTLTATNAGGSRAATTIVRVVAEHDQSVAPSSTARSGTSIQGLTETEWRPVANNLVDVPSECGNLSFVSAHPSKDMVIVGVANGGLWASFDDSDEWTQLGDAGGVAVTNRTTTIVYDPDDPNTWWESGIYSGPGVVKTTDNGSTFEALGTITHSDMVSIDLEDPERRTMLSATHESREIWRSQDAGATWQDITAPLPGDIGMTSSVHVIDPSTYLVGTKPSYQVGPNGSEGIYRTTNGGMTWTHVFDLGVVGRPLDMSDGTLHWLVAGGLGMVTSHDAGATWAFAGDGPHADLAMSVIELPGDRLATTSGRYVIVSSDGGNSWETVGPELPFDVSGIAFSEPRNAFYAWYWDCTDEIKPDSIVRFDLDSSDGAA